MNGGTICTPVNYSRVCDLNRGPTEWHMCIVSALYHSTTQDCVTSWLLGGILIAAFIVQNVIKKEKEMLYVINLL